MPNPIVAYVIRPAIQIGFNGNGDLSVTFPGSVQTGPFSLDGSGDSFEISLGEESQIYFPSNDNMEGIVNGTPFDLSNQPGGPTLHFPSGGRLTLQCVPIEGKKRIKVGIDAKNAKIFIRPITME